MDVKDRVGPTTQCKSTSTISPEPPKYPNIVWRTFSGLFARTSWMLCCNTGSKQTLANDVLEKVRRGNFMTLPC